MVVMVLSLSDINFNRRRYDCTFTTTFNTDTLPYDLSSMEEYKSDFTSRVGEIIDGAFPDEPI